ncbi:DNA polymerase III subunit beta [Corynebacterium caspium]|uniref:DNA polymerase III subunit beta n=1 Tax=Corynebacterium caspium TaxID=234828 RepID=UPI00036B7853|nr:DNA polymerase III subunit beta [Corynebacterium caspium]WKD58441.1 DNA polymerase III subunit beta [Corynebacterium caspium DSM 44850]
MNTQQEVSFRVSKDDLGDAVAWVASNLPSKPVQPVLRAIVVNVNEEGLELRGFDSELSTRVIIPAEVNTHGTFAVAGKLLADITKTLPNKQVDFSTDSTKVYLRCGSARFELPLVPLDDYPKVPTIPETTGTIEANIFSRAINQVAAAAGRDDTLPMLTGVHVEISDKNIVMSATDRFRLAQRRLEWNPAYPGLETKLLIPAKTLQDNARSLDNNQVEPVKVAVGAGEKLGNEGLFGLEINNRQTTTRMLDAEFPNIEPLLPKAHTYMAMVEIARLQEAIRRVSLVTERNAQIRLEFSADEVILSAGGIDGGHAEESLPCVFIGPESLTIAFNPIYLRDGLSVIETNNVVFGFTEASRPAILIPEPEEGLPELGPDGSYPSPQTDFTYLLMPVRLPS